MSNALRAMNRDLMPKEKKKVVAQVTPIEKAEQTKEITQAGLNIVLYKLLVAMGGHISVKCDAMKLPPGCNLHINYNKEIDGFDLDATVPQSVGPKLYVPGKEIIKP